MIEAVPEFNITIGITFSNFCSMQNSSIDSRRSIGVGIFSAGICTRVVDVQAVHAIVSRRWVS